MMPGKPLLLAASRAKQRIPPRLACLPSKLGLARRSGADKNAAFASLSRSDRDAILNILRQTKADLPGYWQASLPDETQRWKTGNIDVSRRHPSAPFDAADRRPIPIVDKH